MKKKLIKINYCILALIILFFQNIKAEGLFDQGKQIFLEEGNCAMCHTLQDANSHGSIGPNLDEIKPDIMRIILAVTNGIGVMPALEGQLSKEEIKAVAAYVEKSTN